MLKKFTIYVFCTFCVIFETKAQFSIDYDSLSTNSYVGEFDLISKNKIRNTTSNPDTIVWTRIVNNLPNSSWTSAVCDINLCHGVTVNTAEFILEPNSIGDLSFHFYPGMNNAKGNMVVRFSKKSDPSYYYDVVITSQVYGLSLHSFDNIGFKLFPNPASNTISISSENIVEGTFRIVNLLGEQLMYNFFKANQRIDVSTLPKGVYIIKIQSGNLLAASKLFVE